MNRSQTAVYVFLLGACLAVAMVAGWSTLGTQFDNDVYDFLFRLHPPEARAEASVILGIDEETFSTTPGGPRAIRAILAEGLERIQAAGPAVVVIDVILTDPPRGPGEEAEDRRLEEALADARHVVLTANLVRRGSRVVWELPRPEFARSASAIAHVHADPDFFDNVVREVSLEKIDHSRGRRFWALSLEAYRLFRGVSIVEDPDGLQLGEVWIPGRRAEARPMLIRYLRPPAGEPLSIPSLTVAELRRNPGAAARVRGKAVFFGITADGAQDRHMTPYSFGLPMPGVEINANAFETMIRGDFLRRASNLATFLACAALTAAAGAVFWRRSGWLAYVLGGAILLPVHVAPYVAFRYGVVFPYLGPLFAAWFSVVAAATFQHFVVRRALRRAAAEKERYQKAIHFVAHEMRSPLTAIQGTSELMGRYKLSDDKRAEMTRMINSESKRLARMIQTFLDVERLSEGEMQLRREDFSVRSLVGICLDRVRPLAARKNIAIHVTEGPDAIVNGDRELMEYAVYNLLTNAVKYSPADTLVTVTVSLDAGRARISVRDQGIGMDEKELKNIFQRFYRTKKAEASGETGTGIGLSIVEQIVSHHGGKVEVTSSPGQGSCFTIVVPAAVPGQVSAAVPANEPEDARPFRDV